MKNSQILPESDSQKSLRNSEKNWELKNTPKQTTQNNNNKILLVITYLYGIRPSFEITATDQGKNIMAEIGRKAAVVDKELYKNISKQDIASLKNITGNLAQIQH